MYIYTGKIFFYYCINSNTSLFTEYVKTKKLIILKELGKITL